MGQVVPLKEEQHSADWSLLDHVEAGLVVTDENRNILQINPSALRLIAQANIPFQEWVGRDCADLLTCSNPVSAFQNGARPVLKIGNKVLGGAVSLFNYQDNEKQGLVITLTDITSQRLLVAEAVTLSDQVNNGNLSTRIIDFSDNRVAGNIGSSINHVMQLIEREFTALLSYTESMAECDFNITADDSSAHQGEFEQIRKGFAITLSNLTESIRQTIRSADQISRAVSAIGEQNRTLAARTQSQADFLQETTLNMEEFSATIDTAADNAQYAANQGQQIKQLTNEGREAVNKVLESMESINQSSLEAGEFIGLISDIALQTSILSMNAAIEAARAGAQGKGFAVVAEEVRALAGKTADASQAIKDLIETSVAQSEYGKQVAQEADEKIVQTSESIQAYSDRINSISETAREQTLKVRNVNDAIQRLDQITRSNNELVTELSKNTEQLDRQAVDLKDAAMVFKLPNNKFSHALHERAHQVSCDASKAVAAAFELAIKQQVISAEELFCQEYFPISNTDPEKHHSRFDKFTDNVLPPIQERILQEHPEFVYAITADFNGYVPTHNDKFCQQLTGDYDKDLVGNRTKRVFSDRVGQLVGRNEEPFILQTYRRDTGELMFDLSVPIIVAGKHWGGFRIGYRIE